MAYKSQHHEEQCEGAQGGDAPCGRPGLPPPLSSRTISADTSSQLSERAGWESIWTTPPHFGEEGTRELSCRIKAMPHQSESDGRWSEAFSPRTQGMDLCNERSGTHISRCGNPSSSTAPPFEHLQKKVLIFLARFPPRMGGGAEVDVAVWQEISSWPSYLFDSSNYFLFVSPLQWSSITQQIVSE